MTARTHVFRDYTATCLALAARIAEIIRAKPNAVLGLATGSSPIGIYQELVRLHREEGLDFSGVTTFNLDEYYPMHRDAPQSYHRFMREHLFDHVNCNNWNVPDGTPRPDAALRALCEDYEARIAAAGGLDFQLLGIGRTGHIGFNEPGSGLETRTRLVTLDHRTRADAAGDFFGLENVPVRAITMGVGTVMSAREIGLIASGLKKSEIVAEALEGKITSKVPASFLREHPNANWFLDEAAASELTAFARPWRAPEADFSDFDLRRRTLISLSQEFDKPLGKLTQTDLSRAGMDKLTHSVASLEAVTQEIEVDLKHRTDDERHLPSGKRVLCLSPHPDDDVICCGATLIKMAQNNTVSVAYGVSGSTAVRDKDVLALLRARHPRLVSYLEDALAPGKTLDDAFNEVRSFIFEREPGAPDSSLLWELKRLVREGEAADGCRGMGARPIFLNLPFYRTRKTEKAPLSDEDINTCLRTLRDVKPELVLLTGDTDDPHGTHEVCNQAFARATEQYLAEGGEPFRIWRYRGAWNEYEAWEGDYFSLFEQPLMERKIGLILDHISQLDPVFPGDSDPREFYERARDRNRANARQLQQLGILPPSRSFAPVYAEVFKIEA